MGQLENGSLFFENFEDKKELSNIIELLKKYSSENNKQVYVTDKILGITKEYKYNVSQVIYVMIPSMHIVIIGYGNVSNEELEEYRDDFIDDLSHVVDKYNYDKKLGRPREWKKFIQYTRIENYDIDTFSCEQSENGSRKIDLLISLLIGSINNIENIEINKPNNDLDAIKQKIILFDGKQSGFIYQKPEEKRIVIQGLAGTGKTELLLHKLKEVYNDQNDYKIAFTCFNKVLAHSLRTRIPKFFNFMKISKQIVWNENLFVFASWGSRNIPQSGLYSYVCDFYKLDFYNLSQNRDFESVCAIALEELSNKEQTPCFDFLFIDESQDFGENFFKLCEKITKYTVYIAGDIFQDIFDRNIDETTSPHYLLNNCYRTDPKTLMLAHAVGLGLYEDPPIDWLNDSDWTACGYSFERKKNNNDFILTRTPLRRFEDIQSIRTAEIVSIEMEDFVNKVIEIIHKLKQEFSTVEPHDIGIIVNCGYKAAARISTAMQVHIYENFGWGSSLGFESKKYEKEKVYISNVNHVKGLEFPFVICLVPTSIGTSTRFRNSLYMSITRSFLRTYCLILKDYNIDFINKYSDALEHLYKYGNLTVKEPSAKTKGAIKSNKKRITLKNARTPIRDTLFKEAKREFGTTVTDEKINAAINFFSNKFSIEDDEELVSLINDMIRKSL